MDWEDGARGVDEIKGPGHLMQLPSEEIPQRRPGKKRIGEILIEMGLVTPLQLEEALDEQKSSHLRIGEILVAQGLLTGVELTEALARRPVSYTHLTLPTILRV